MPTIIDGTLGLTTPTYGGADTAEYIVPVTAFKNRLINSGMQIDQRNAGASVSSISNGGTYTLDRWLAYSSPTNRFSVQQNAGSVTPPAGYRNYLGITSASSYSSLTNDYFGITQIIEGFNMADFNYGSANAQTVTLSFWVRSSLTGTFSGALRNGGINDYSYVFTYTISAANTWEYKTITITGVTAGTWLTTNGQGLWVWWDLGTGSSQTTSTVNAWQNANNLRATGSVSIVGTNGATFYITGVQLEVGSTATSFDYRPYGTELALCQRYCQNYNSNTWSDPFCRYTNVIINASSNYNGIYPLFVPMRAIPSVTTSGTFSLWNGLFQTANPPLFQSAGPNVVDIGAACGSGATVGAVYHLLSNNNNTSFIQFTAEL